MNIDLPQLVFKKTGTVLNRTLHNADSSVSRYTVRRLIPGEDTFLSQKGVGRIRKDSECSTVHVYDKEGRLVLSDIPQKIRQKFNMMREFPNINLNSFLK